MNDHGHKVDPLRTALAAKGVELSAMFFVVFEDFKIPGEPPRQPRLVAPHGPSTAGGKLSRQNISLVPLEGQTGQTVVAGWADSSTHRAELRSYEVLAEAFARRRGRPLDIPQAAYRRFLKRAEEFFRDQGFVIVMVTSPTPGAAPRRGQSPWVIALLLFTVLLLGVVLGVVWMLYERGALGVPSP